jgi:hypothetical protein
MAFTAIDRYRYNGSWYRQRECMPACCCLLHLRVPHRARMACRSDPAFDSASWSARITGMEATSTRNWVTDVAQFLKAVDEHECKLL